MRIAKAGTGDFTGFVDLAAEVEDWFGPMVNDPGFHDAVRKNIARRSALIASVAGRVVGALLFSRHPAPTYDIGWLVLTADRRSEGIGQALIASAVRGWVRPPAVLSVVTFGADHPGARSRRFYTRLGFEPVQTVQPGPEGEPRERFELRLAQLPYWAT